MFSVGRWQKKSHRATETKQNPGWRTPPWLAHADAQVALGASRNHSGAWQCYTWWGVRGGGGEDTDTSVKTVDSAAAHSEDLWLASTQSLRILTGLRTSSKTSWGCPLYSKGLRCRSGLDGDRTRDGQICVISNDSVRLRGNIQLSSLFRKGQVVEPRLTRVSILSPSRDLRKLTAE